MAQPNTYKQTQAHLPRQSASNDQFQALMQQQISPPEQPLDLNLKHARTKSGLLKIFSFFFGLIAVYLSAYAYDNATWFIEIPGTRCTSYLVGERTCYGGEYPLEVYCRAANLKLKHEAENSGATVNEDLIQTCPTMWLVLPQIYILGIILGSTIIGFVAMLISERTAQTCRTNDGNFCGYIFVGLLTIVCGACFIAYAIQVFVRDDCKDAKETEIRSHSAANQTARQSPDSISGCFHKLKPLFQHWRILIAGFFAFITGVLQLIIAIVSRGGGKAMVQPRPQYIVPSQTRMLYPSQAQRQAMPPQQPNQYLNIQHAQSNNPAQTPPDNL